MVVNRGEIAARIFRACRELGVPSVAIYSEADAGAAWVLSADEAYPLPGVTATESYLNQDAIFEIVARAGVDAIHPGYGFLSENAGFAEACAARSVTFIGPSTEAITLMGSKARAREIAANANVPLVPGIDGDGVSDDALQAEADKIGYPTLIKASAGGGGKGMRVVWQREEFADALQSARSEARNSFGDDRVILERYFTQIHHVEIQVLGDHHGNVVHLFERECSIQRRHQKIVEETPSPLMTDDLRSRMTTAAVALANAVNYYSAGTVEFIVTPERDFFFLEMNTRLQVEHPITELVTGIDLAAWQIRVAAGEKLAFSQDDLTQMGHALECRVYAEDPAMGFLPSIGEVSGYIRPNLPNTRIDDGIAAGATVSPYYDPMLAKVITFGANRDQSIARMQQALEQYVVLGVKTNIHYLLGILKQERFIAGKTPTSYIDEMEEVPAPTVDKDTLLIAALAETLSGRAAQAVPQSNGQQQVDPWLMLPAWRNVAAA